MNERDLSVPKESPKDVLHSTLKGIVDLTPVIGGILSEVFGYIIPAPIDNRRIEWMKSVSESIYELQEKNEFQIDSLSENEMFITSIIRASQISQRTHQKEIRDALKNAVINSALNIDISENNQILYLNYLDSVTPIHIKILYFFANPKKYYSSISMVPNDQIDSIEKAILVILIPQIGYISEEIVGFYVDDLFYKGLITINKVAITKIEKFSTVYSKYSTTFGDRFLEYITFDTACT